MKSNVNLFLEAGAVPKNDDNSQLALVLASKTENTQRTDGCTIQPTVYGPI